MKIAIIDDLIECINEIRSCINLFFQEHYINELIDINDYSSGEEFLSNFRKDSFDLIFIDQYMNGLSGISTAKKIRQIDELVVLVFITSSRDHAVDSYQVRASGYLLKPFTYIDFKNTLSIIGIKKLKNARFICIDNEKILLREILWCNIDGHYIQIHTTQRGILRYRLPFKTVSNELQKYSQFLTCYKGCIINLDHVERIDNVDFILMTGEKVPFSKRYKKKIETDYHSYLFQKAREDNILW